MFEPSGLQAVAHADCAPVQVGRGCLRYDLPSRPGMRVWIVEMEPGAEWPWVDEHDAMGEDVFVLEGELIEGERSYGPGTYLHFAPHSCHRPRTQIGVRLAGVNLLERSLETSL